MDAPKCNYAKGYLDLFTTSGHSMPLYPYMTKGTWRSTSDGDWFESSDWGQRQSFLLQSMYEKGLDK